MKVAMIGHKIVPSRRGGIEKVLTTLCPLLVERGVEVTCYNRSTDKIENEYIGTVEKGRYKGVKLKSAFTLKVRGVSAMIASFTAAFCAAFGRYDVVHFHAEGPCAALWLPKMFGKKCVATVHGLDWQREKWGKGFASKYIKFGEKILAKYLYYYLQKEHLEQYNTAGGVPSLTQTVLNAVKIVILLLRVPQD